MPSDLYWIETAAALRLAIMARPRAGDWLEDEVEHWRQEGVGVVLSLLERDEVDELGLRGEPDMCHRAGIDFVSFPIPDRGTPSDAQAALETVRELAKRNKPIAIHCRAGIGRSSLMAALLLGLSGMEVGQAFSAISEARGLTVPDTDDQRSWVEEAYGVHGGGAV